MSTSARAASMDANVLLRLVIRDIPDQYEQASALLRNSKLLHVADLAIAEVAYVLENNYRLNKLAVADAVSVILNEPRISCNRVVFDNALPLYIKYPKLSLVDCCLASYAMIDDTEPLWTFDKKLANQIRAAKLVS